MSCCKLTWAFYLLTIFVLNYAYRLWRARPRKTFTQAEPTNILITGGLHGLGKLLTLKFAKNFNKDEVKLIVVNRSDT